jgi:hypothetical protein
MFGHAYAGLGLTTCLDDVIPLDRAPNPMRHARPTCREGRQRLGDLGRLCRFDEVVVFFFEVRIESHGDESGHVDGCRTLARPPRMKARGRIGGRRREACETCSLSGVRRFDEQGEGVDGRHARNAGQDREVSDEACIRSGNFEDCRIDRRDLTFDLIETLGILAFQQCEILANGTPATPSACSNAR